MFTQHYIADAASGRSAVPPPTAGAISAPKSRSWFRTRRSSNPQPTVLLARTVTEAYLFMELRPCTCGETGFASQKGATRGHMTRSFSGACASCGVWREFVFRLPDEVVPPGEARFGDGNPSKLLDPGEWLWVADRYASGPADKSGLDEDARQRAHRQVALAAAAMDEVLAFVPAGKSAVPAKAFRTERGRAVYAKEPGRFRRERLHVVRDTYRKIAADLEPSRPDTSQLAQATVTPVAARQRIPVQIPSWCSWFTPDQWEQFHETVSRTLADQGEAVPADEPDTVTITQMDGGTFELGLAYVADMVRHLPPTQWRPKIAAYFDDQRAQAEALRREVFGRSLEHVRQMVRPRLLCRDLVPRRSGLLMRELGADLVALLEVEAPRTRHFVRATDLDQWGVLPEHLWETAASNLRREDHGISRKGSFSWVTGSSRYVASHVLRLAELVGHSTPFGVLVAVPHPDMVLFHPVRDVESVMVLRQLPSAVASFYGGQFGALSPKVYWWLDGVFEHVTVTDVDNQVTINGSERVTAVLNRLLWEAGDKPR